MLTAIMVERVEKWQAITGFVFQLKCKAFASLLLRPPFFQIVVKLLDWKKANFELSRTKSPFKKKSKKIKQNGELKLHQEAIQGLQNWDCYHYR